MAEPTSYERLASAYRNVFDGPDGRIVLDDLKIQGGFRRSTFLHTQEPNGTIYAEGRRSLLLHVLDMIEAEPPAEQTEYESEDDHAEDQAEPG